MLNRVYRESCRVLSLSHRPAPAGQPHPDSEEAPPPSWQRERRALQETVLSLRELLCRMAEREPKVADLIRPNSAVELLSIHMMVNKPSLL